MLYKTISAGLQKSTSPAESTRESEIERTIVGILTHPKATSSIKQATKLLIREYENISAMENRLLGLVNSSERKTSVQENLAHKNVQNKIKAMEERFMKWLLCLQTEEISKVEAECADVLLRHQAVQKAKKSVRMPEGH